MIKRHKPFQRSPGGVGKWLNLLVVPALLLSLAPLAPVAAKDDPPRAHPALLQLAAEHPDEVFWVIVQREVKNKDLPDDDPEAAVEEAGGKVKKQLRMIEAFSAELTGKEIEKLAKNPKVRWITFDAPLISTAAGSQTVRDEFASASYANNNGSRAWLGNWIEIGDDGTAGAGYVRVSNGSLQLKYVNRTLSRAANLAGAVAATLSFQYKRSSFDTADDYVAVRVSADGGWTWTELARFAGPATDSAWQTATFGIANYATPFMLIQLATSSSLGSSDVLYVDDLQIEYVLPSPFIRAVRADQVWNAGGSGQGVTVAVIDSGIAGHPDLQASGGASRVIANAQFGNNLAPGDNNGHGTHVAGIVGGSGVYAGVAPGANLIDVKITDDQGMSTASDLVAGLQWVLDNRAAYNIRVVNLSLNSAIAESYHTSPIDAAVEILWFNGIVVVVAAGNNGTGSGPVTLYPPANDPFVITVGAAEDRGTPALSDDGLAVFSAYGVTEDNFAKPELVAPGRNLVSLQAGPGAHLAVNHPTHQVGSGSQYFRMSGTSMSAPVVSGAVALLLQDEPNLTPDQVKYRLKATANTAWPGYNAAQAGAGYLDVYAAVTGTTTESANTGLAASQMLTMGSDAIGSSVNWNSVNWNSVNWNSVNWNSVNWNSVNWNSVNWNSSVWDD